MESEVDRDGKMMMRRFLVRLPETEQEKFVTAIVEANYFYVKGRCLVFEIVGRGPVRAFANDLWKSVRECDT